MRLSGKYCRERQRRFLSKILEKGVETAVVGNSKHVLYLTGYETPPEQSSAVYLDSNGHCILAAPAAVENLAVDETMIVVPKALSTLYLDHDRRIAEAIRNAIKPAGSAIGLDNSRVTAHLGRSLDNSADIECALYSLRRKKDPDELQLLKGAIENTHVCYKRITEILKPGVNEIEVYAEIYRTACRQAGERLPAMGNDFQCASSGGPPRNRNARAGELYIFDLGPEIGGYFADNCRTFSVDRNPTKIQLEAWNRITEVFTLVEETVAPGASCKSLYFEVKKLLDGSWPESFRHHLGHGVGLAPHERPNLNPNWDHTFETGDFFTVEPGLYDPKINAGIRLEENYLVTENGVETLTSFPLDL
jgi:Xaa-Pro aminopeptidase